MDRMRFIASAAAGAFAALVAIGAIACLLVWGRTEDGLEMLAVLPLCSVLIAGTTVLRTSRTRLRSVLLDALAVLIGASVVWAGVGVAVAGASRASDFAVAGLDVAVVGSVFGLLVRGALWLGRALLQSRSSSSAEVPVAGGQDRRPLA